MDNPRAWRGKRFLQFRRRVDPVRDEPETYAGASQEIPRQPGAPRRAAGKRRCQRNAILYGTVLQDGGKFRMWYLAWPLFDKRYPKDTRLPRRPAAYAESSDGIHWQKPDLGLIDFCGSKHNNLISIEPADHPFAVVGDFVSVLRDDADPDPGRRYKMVYIAYLPTLRHSTAVTAISPDGLRWKLASTEEFTKGHFEMTSLVKFQGVYYVSGQNLGRAGGHLADGLDAGRAMTAFFSPDFQHWSSGRALCFFRSHYQPQLENFGQELHMGAGLWNRGNVIVGLYGRWYGDHIDRDPEIRKTAPLYDLKIDLGLVISNDAIHYREPVQNFVMVPPGAEGQWDSHAILQGQAFCNTPNETYIWYSDWYTRNQFSMATMPANTRPHSIGLLTMRRDGFGYLSKQRVRAGQAARVLPCRHQREPAHAQDHAPARQPTVPEHRRRDPRCGVAGVRGRRCRATVAGVSRGDHPAKRTARAGRLRREQPFGGQGLSRARGVARRRSQSAVRSLYFQP